MTAGHRCQLEVVRGGLSSYLKELTNLMTGWFQVGLFANDRLPLLDDLVGDYIPCDFSGYNGLRLFYGWSAPVASGVFSMSSASPIVWAHDGGPINNLVYGYYVLDRFGVLAFAERFCDGPFVLDRAGRKLVITPTFRASNEREEV